MNPADFLGIVKGKGTSKPAFRLGTIPEGYTSGRPTVILDGEEAASDRTYPYLASYTPAAGDRVLIANVGVNGGGVIVGKVV